MNSVESYLKRATRGLHGAKRQEAQAELRGAIEDKIYRYTLLGLTPHDAEAAALRDLGNPTAIARELTEIHTLPPIVKYTLLVGLTGLLSFQATAKTYVVNAAPAPLEVRQQSCNMDLKQASRNGGDYLKYVQQQIQIHGSAAKAQAACLENLPNPTRFMRVADLNAALKAAGFKVFEDPMLPGRVAVDFEGNGNYTTLIDAGTYRSGTINNEAYVEGAWFLFNLRNFSKQALNLQGSLNPTLTIGKMTAQLGTRARPVQTAQLLAPLIAQDLGNMLRPQASADASFKDVAWMDTPASGIPLKVNSPEGSLYALLQTESQCDCAADIQNRKFLTLSLYHVKNGQIELPISPNARAASVKDFLGYRAKGKSDALLYKVDTGDLRNVKFTLVPPTWK